MFAQRLLVATVHNIVFKLDRYNRPNMRLSLPYMRDTPVTDLTFILLSITSYITNIHYNINITHATEYNTSHGI